MKSDAQTYFVADLTFARVTFFATHACDTSCFLAFALDTWIYCAFVNVNSPQMTIVLQKKFRFEVTKDLKYPQQKYFIQTFCLNMTLCFYRVAVPRHQSASHHIGFSQACPARLGKQHFPANHLLRRKEAVI